MGCAKKVRIIREPTPEEVALGSLCVALERPKQRQITKTEYLAEASEISLGQLSLDNLGESTESRRDALVALNSWVGRLANAQAATIIRRFFLARATQALAPPPPPPRPMRRQKAGKALGLDPTTVAGLGIEPFFMPKEISVIFLRLLNAVQRRRWAFHYEDHGCLLCGTKKRPHEADGLCPKCYARTLARLNASLTKHAGERAEAEERLEAMSYTIQAANAPEIAVNGAELAILRSPRTKTGQRKD